MAHIIILGTWKSMIEQMHVYSHQIQEKIDNNEFHGQQLVAAEKAQQDLEELWNSINTSFITEADNVVGQQEQVLGI